MLSNGTALPGQETLVASWYALAELSPGARMVEVSSARAAVFPSWAPLNNAIVLSADVDAVAAAVSELADVYADGLVDGWALWLPTAPRAWMWLTRETLSASNVTRRHS